MILSPWWDLNPQSSVLTVNLFAFGLQQLLMLTLRERLVKRNPKLFSNCDKSKNPKQRHDHAANGVSRQKSNKNGGHCSDDLAT